MLYLKYVNQTLAYFWSLGEFECNFERYKITPDYMVPKSQCALPQMLPVMKTWAGAWEGAKANLRDSVVNLDEVPPGAYLDNSF